MKRLIINVPDSSNIPVWITFINAHKADKYPVLPALVQVNFSEINFIYPYHLVSLACLIEEYYIKGAKIVFEFAKGRSNKIYLDKIKFTEFWEEGFYRNEYNFQDRCLPLWKIEYPRISPFVDAAQNYFEHNFLSNADISPLGIVLSEIFNNVEDHSESLVNGFTLTQYYPQKHSLVCSICDFGVGIPQKIRAYLSKQGKKPPVPEECIDLALSQGFSTKSTPKNRGLGLDNVFSNVKTTNGILQIISNNVYFSKKKDDSKDLRVLKENFSGTHIVITLDTFRFEQKEEGLLDEILF